MLVQLIKCKYQKSKPIASETLRLDNKLSLGSAFYKLKDTKCRYYMYGPATLK